MAHVFDLHTALARGDGARFAGVVGAAACTYVGGTTSFDGVRWASGGAEIPARDVRAMKRGLIDTPRRA